MVFPLGSLAVSVKSVLCFLVLRYSFLSAIVDSADVLHADTDLLCNHRLFSRRSRLTSMKKTHQT